MRLTKSVSRPVLLMVEVSTRLPLAHYAQSVCSPAAVEIGPFARLDEARPIVWMPARRLFEHFQLHLPQCLTAPLSLLQLAVIGHHQISRRLVQDGPEAHHLRLRAGQRQ